MWTRVGYPYEGGYIYRKTATRRQRPKIKRKEIHLSDANSKNLFLAEVK